MANITIDYNFSDDDYVITIGDTTNVDISHIQSLRKINSNMFKCPVNYGSTADLKRINGAAWTDRANTAVNGVSLRRDYARRAKVNPTISADEDLFAFQRRSANMLWEALHGFINDDTGLGKTRTAIAIASDVMGPHLVVCPKIAKHVWVSEIAKVEPDMAVLAVDGTAAQRRKQLTFDNIIKYDFIIMNYEQLKSHTSYPSWTQKYAGDDERKELDAVEWGCVILDEGHRIKNPASIQTRCAWRLADHSTNRYVLTATPITVDPGDLWAQLRFISPKEFASRSKFRDAYFNWAEGPHGGIDILGWKQGMDAVFNTAMDWRTSKNTYEDPDVHAELEDMPEAVEPTILEIDLTTAQRSLYKTMVENMMIDLAAMDKDEFLIAASKVERWIRLRQIANGIPMISSDDEVIGLDLPSNKVVALLDLLDGVNGAVVIYAEHAKVIYMAYTALVDHDYNCRLITGQIRDDVRQRNINDFQAGEIDVLLCTMGAASESITLTNAAMLVIMQESTSLRHMIQARGRVRRIGSTAPVPVYVMRSVGTVEISLADGNGEKADFLDGYLETPNRYRDLLMGKLH